MRIKVKRPVWDDFTAETVSDEVTNEPITSFSVLKSVLGMNMYVFSPNNPAWTFINTMNRVKGLLGANVPAISTLTILGSDQLPAGYTIDRNYPGQEEISSEAQCYLTFTYDNTPVALALWIDYCN